MQVSASGKRTANSRQRGWMSYGIDSIRFDPMRCDAMLQWHSNTSSNLSGVFRCTLPVCVDLRSPRLPQKCDLRVSTNTRSQKGERERDGETERQRDAPSRRIEFHSSGTGAVWRISSWEILEFNQESNTSSPYCIRASLLQPIATLAPRCAVLSLKAPCFWFGLGLPSPVFYF